MNIKKFDAICSALPHATLVEQWGGIHVWKIGGKMFAVAEGNAPGAVLPWFKASDATRPMLLERDGIVPAPYLARAGWVAMSDPKALSDADLAAYLGAAYRTIASKLPRKTRVALGLTEVVSGTP